jgi:predicted lipoprotein with Yx(FWY)xxD motif
MSPTGRFPLRLLIPTIATVTLLAACQAGANQTATSGEGTGAGGATVTLASDADVGDFVVDADGRTLYIFLKDTENTSNCADDCAAKWPPATVGEGESPTAGDGISADLATIQRDDGSTQLTLDGAPLYRYTPDQAQGDINGEGVGGVWFVARPDGAKPSPSTSGEESEGPEATSSEDDDGIGY